MLGLAEAKLSCSLLICISIYVYIYILLPTRDIAGQKFIIGQDFQVMNKFVLKVASFSLSPLHCIESLQFYLCCLAKLYSSCRRLHSTQPAAGFNKEVLRSHEVCAVQFSDDINANQIYYYMKIAV